MVRLRNSSSGSFGERKLLDRIAELSAATDFAALSRCIMQSFPDLVDCDWCSFNEVRGSDGMVLSHKGRTQLAFYDVNQLVRDHPLVAQFVQSKCPTTFCMSDVMTRSQFHRSRIYNNMFRPIGAEHQMCLAVADADLSLALIVGFQRSGSDYRRADREILHRLAPHLKNAWENVRLIERLSAKISSASAALNSSSLSLVSLGAGQRIESIDDACRARLKRFFPNWMESDTQLPAGLRELLANMRFSARTEAHVDRDCWRLNIRLLPAGSVGLTSRSGGFSEHQSMLLEERRVRVQPADLRGLGLTERETQVLYWITEGKTDPAIATILNCGTRTVHKHVEHILKKLNAESRTAAATRTLEKLVDSHPPRFGEPNMRSI